MDLPQEIEHELIHQIDKGASLSADSAQSLGDFITYTSEYMRRTVKAYSGFPIEEAHAKARKQFVKVGALVVAYLRSHPE